MYQSFYGFRERPFELTSDLRYLLLTPKHQEALAHLEYGTSTGTGITLLIGEPGTGKTTLLRKVLASRPRPAPSQFVFLTNPALSRHEFFDFLAHGFQLTPEAGRSKTKFLRELDRTIVARKEQGTTAVLVIDEAQSLPDELLEEVRLLANIETETEKLLRVILAGHPALGDRLNEPGFRQLKQRIGLRCLLPPLDLHETAAYIAYRIGLAGGSPARTFSPDAVIAIFERSGGIPRTINVICENALLTGFAADQRPIEPEIVFEVCGDFDLLPRVVAAPNSPFAPVGAHGQRSGRATAPPGLGPHAPNSTTGHDRTNRTDKSDAEPSARRLASFPYLRLPRR
jgi:general secretion pathway protein A